jgi:hypothetical protein
LSYLNKLDNVVNIKLGPNSISISYPKLISWTNSSVNNNLTYILGCLIQISQKQSKTLFKPTYLVYPGYPNYISVAICPQLGWQLQEEMSKKTNHVKKRISINSSLQRSSWIVSGIKIHNSGWSLSLLYSSLPQPILAITVPHLT